MQFDKKFISQTETKKALCCLSKVYKKLNTLKKANNNAHHSCFQQDWWQHFTQTILPHDTTFYSTEWSKKLLKMPPQPCMTKNRTMLVESAHSSGLIPLKNKRECMILDELRRNSIKAMSLIEKSRGAPVKKYKFIPMEYSLESFKRSNQDTCINHKPAVFEGDWIQSGDILTDCASSVGGELSLGQNLLIAYMPWEGYNFEDAILISERLVIDDLYTSVHIERYEMEINQTILGNEEITREIPDVADTEVENLNSFGIIKIGSWVEEGDILVGKILPINKKKISPYQKLLYTILDKKVRPFRDSSLRAPKGVKAKVIDIKYFYKSYNSIMDKIVKKKNKTPLTTQKNKTTLSLKKAALPMRDIITDSPRADSKKVASLKMKQGDAKKGSVHLKSTLRKSLEAHMQKRKIETIHIYLAETRKIQVGDKMSGRHGNKGIVSQILPIQDMPYLPDGTPIDMLLNPLGVPSRMNVGQIYECLLGLAGKYLGENYKIFGFDEIYGPEASRSFVFNKLYKARTTTGLKWLFDPNTPGKIRIYDGRTGETFDQAVTVGHTYILRLVHMVDDKIHMRSTGPYSLVTQQPLRGRSKEGGQRLGEMEVWALEGYGAAFTLLEMLTIKSDDMTGRMTLWSNLILNKEISIGTPESFKVLICELQALCLDIGLFRYTQSATPRKTPKTFYQLEGSTVEDQGLGVSGLWKGNKNNQLTEINSLINLP